MSSLADYIRWYSDFTFYEKPFNEVDNLVLSMLSYYQYSLKRSDGKPMSLRRAVTNSFDNDEVLEAAYLSRRFGTLMVSDYVSVFDRKNKSQFAAMTFHLYDNMYYIAFRGTDNSMVGWREDFMISYKKTDGQRYAAEYLDEHLTVDCQYIVGGHSKGGNLALYGCCHLPERKLIRVKHIYNNDGPGLCPEVSDISLINKVIDRTTLILPQYCVFGKIFSHDYKDVKIVTSSYNGIMQHGIISWGVDHGELDTVEDCAPESAWINVVADQWLKDVNPQEREKLVNSVFDTFDKDGNATYTDALANGIDGIEDLLKNMVEADTLKTAAKFPEKAIFGDFFSRLRQGKLAKFINANELVEGILFVVFGVLMLIIPKQALQLIILLLLCGVLMFQLVYTIKCLYKSKWNFELERGRVYIFVALATGFALIVVKEQASFVVGSGIAGAWLLIIAYRSFLSAKGSVKHDFQFYKNAVKAILYACCGVFVMFAPIEMLRWIVLSLGGLMTVDGICTIVYSFIQANDRYSAKYSHMKEKVRIKGREKNPSD